MEMKCLRENLQMERLVGSAQGQAAVEGEITLPGGLREEARVLSAGAMVVLDNVEAQQDKVVLEGRVVFHALYTQGDRMRCRGDAAVEHVEAAAYSGRLGLKAILQTRCRVLSSQPVAALTGIAGVEGLEQRTCTLSLKRTVAQGQAEALLREEFDLPAGLQITQTLYGTALPRVTEVTGGLGRAAGDPGL